MKLIISAILELAGAVAIIAGVYLTVGAGVALLVGGLLAIVFGFALDGPIRIRR